MPPALAAPVAGKVAITPHGYYGAPRPTRGAGAVHRGVDFQVTRGQPVLAVADGTIARIGYDPPPKLVAGKNTGGGGGGNFVILSHNFAGEPWETAYMHLTQALGGAGQAVKAGQQIGTAGDSGAPSGGVHLHFELRRTVGGVRDNQDPTALFGYTSPPPLVASAPSSTSAPAPMPPPQPIATSPPSTPPAARDDGTGAALVASAIAVLSRLIIG